MQKEASEMANNEPTSEIEAIYEVAGKPYEAFTNPRGRGAEDTHCPTTPNHSFQRIAHTVQHSERMNDKFASATYGANLFQGNGVFSRGCAPSDLYRPR